MTEFGQRHAALVPQLPRLRLAAAALILGAAFAGAAILHGHRALQTHSGCNAQEGCHYFVRLGKPGWVDPVVLGICLLGLAAAVGVLVGLRQLGRLAGAALVAGAGVVGAVALSGHRIQGGTHSCPYGASAYECSYHPRPGWVTPTMVGLVVLGLAGASGVLVATRRRSTGQAART